SAPSTGPRKDSGILAPTKSLSTSATFFACASLRSALAISSPISSFMGARYFRNFRDTTGAETPKRGPFLPSLAPCCRLPQVLRHAREARQGGSHVLPGCPPVCCHPEKPRQDPEQSGKLREDAELRRQQLHQRAPRPGHAAARRPDSDRLRQRKGGSRGTGRQRCAA